MKKVFFAVSLALLLITGCTGNNPTSHGNAPVLAGDRIIGFNFYYPGGSFSCPEYEIVKTEEGFVLKGRTLRRDFEMVIDEDVLRDLHDIIIEYNILSWNGFDQRAPDREMTTANGMFGLYIVYDDQTVISARGDHAYPDGYKEAEEALVDFFDGLTQ